MHFFKPIAAGLAAFSLLSPSVVNAGINDVSSPSVTKGKSSIEARVVVDADKDSSKDGRVDTRIQYDHGFTDYYALRISATQKRAPNDKYRHNNVRVENRFQLFEAEQDGFDGGFRVLYSAYDGSQQPDELAVSLLAAKTIADWALRTNVLFGNEIGKSSDDGLTAEWRWQAMYPVADVRVGLEGFHELGRLNEGSGWEDQNHQLGLVMKGDFNDDWSYQTGYEHGISRVAPDHSVKFFLTRSF